MTPCGVCNESVTNPICSECLQAEVSHWMNDFKAGNTDKVSSVTKLFSHFKTGVKCIVCNNELNVCAHCYCKEAKEHVDKEYARSFVRAFDFELYDLL